MQMADGESGAPGNGGNGVRRSKGTAKKLERSLLPNFPCPLRKGRGQGVAAGMRAVPEDASVLPEEGTEQVALQAGREPEQTENREILPGTKSRGECTDCCSPERLPEHIYRGGRNLQNTSQPPV